MNSVINRTLKHKKLLFLYRRCMSSAALLENPAIEYVENHGELDPLQILSIPTNLRGLTLTETTVAHALLLKRGVIHNNLNRANNLLEDYSACSRMDHAFKLFEEIPLRNSVTWNLMILGCNKNFLYNESWRIFIQMHQMGMDMDEFTYGSALSACGASENVVRGKLIYGFVMKNGFLANGHVRAGMIDLFSRNCRVEDALGVLYDVNCDDLLCWNAVVSGAVTSKDYWVAFGVFNQMCRHDSLTPDAFTFSRVLNACAAVEELEYGKSIHGLVIKSGAESGVFLGNAIVDFYAKSGDMCDAIQQFKLIQIRTFVSWTAILYGFVQKSDSASAARVINDMQKTGDVINKFTVSSMLAAYSNPAMFKEVLQIHCWIFKIGLYLDPVVKASLINSYSKAGAINLSEMAFAEAQDLKQVRIWANMISAYVKSKTYEKTIVFFQRMLKEGITPNNAIASCVFSIIDSITLGIQIHGYTIKVGLVSDVSVGSSILTMYSKCGYLEESLKAFEQLERKNYISWTSMIAGFVEHGHADKALQLFREMWNEECVNDNTLAAVLHACSALHSLKLGREIHGFALRCGFNELTIVDGALVNMYSKCGELHSAVIVFHMMPLKDQAAWSSIISGFSQWGHIEEALKLLKDMILSNVSVDTFTMSAVVGAPAISSKPAIGAQLHACIIKVGLESDAPVANSLVMMYSKGGSIGDCDKVFQQITDPGLAGWTAMIASYAYHGKGLEALRLFYLMKKSGIEPDAVAFTGVLSACSHAGLVSEGYFHLNSMIRDYKLEPGYKHYVCMVDLLGRAGRLEEAERFISNMPIKPDTLVWETLLAACKVHGNHELGKLAAQKIMELRPSDAGAYVSVSNISAEAGEWEHVLKVRDSMQETGVKKNKPGWSLYKT